MSNLSDDSKKALIANLFDKLTDDIDLRDYQDYFRVIDDEIQFLNDYELFQSNNFKLDPKQLNQIALEVVQELKINPGAKQAVIIQKLYDERLPQIRAQGETKGKALLEYILDGTIRIWIMVDTAGSSEPGDYGWRGERKFCDFVHGLFYPGQSAPAYPDNKQTSVRDSELMAELKAEMASENTQIQSALTHPLTAANMKKLTNITTHWANGLNQHLQFDADFRNLSVFPHNRWLFDALDMVHKWRQDNTPLPLENETEGQTEIEQPSMNCPFPIPLEVIQETIRSLDLLFPRYNGPTNRFLKKYNKNLFYFRIKNHGNVQDRVGSKARLKEFFFYHDRLIELAQEFINPPKSWDTIFRDYRNPIQYWTFWIGLVIFIATVVSVVLAGVQVHYAVHPQ